MARGDAVTGIGSVNAGQNVYYQPASGVEVMLTAITWDSVLGTVPNQYFDRLQAGIYDGTNWSKFLQSPLVSDAFKIRIIITNSIYLKIFADTGGASSFKYGYDGIQTK